MTPERLSMTRYDLPALIDERGYETGAEIGVEHGYFSYYLLRHSRLSKLHSIDSYQGKWGVFLSDAESLLQEFGDRSEIHVKSSIAAAMECVLLEQEFDFVYLDGTHRYRPFKHDIDIWWPLVRQGGLLAGHDYTQEHGEGVVRAVTEFVEREGLKLSLTRETWATWMIFKP